MPRPVRLSRTYLHPVLGLASLLPLLLLLNSTSALGINENLTKGATNNHVFEEGVWGEDIDVLNGGLNLTIPIGPAYQVSADVSYQLQLTYSSKIWSLYHPNDNTVPSKSRLSGHQQAGLGFMLQFGRLYERPPSPDRDCPSQMGIYPPMVFEDHTGAVHEDVDNQGLSVDGSYLRFWYNPHRVQSPDGLTYKLGWNVPDLLSEQGQSMPNCVSPGTYPANYDFYTNDYRGRYVTRIEGKDRNPAGDQNGTAYNWVNVAYDPNVGMRHLMTTVADSQGRTINFTNTRFAGTETGVVQSISLPVFSGSSDPNVVVTATYTFVYEVAVVDDPFHPAYPASDNQGGQFENIVLLKKIIFPYGYEMEFEYTGGSSSWLQGRNVGLLRARKLPTGARIEYGWDDYPITSPQVSFQGGFVTRYLSWDGLTFGIVQKRLVEDPNSNPTIAATWSYQRESFASGKPNPYKVISSDPYGNDTVVYFHAITNDSYYYDPNSNNYAYPHEDVWKNGRAYRTEYFRGSSADPGNLVRSEERVWQDRLVYRDPSVPNNYYHTGTYPRVEESRVTYHDDGNRTVRTVNEEWDGWGNFHKITEYGYDGAPYRFHRTDTNCDVRDPNTSQCVRDAAGKLLLSTSHGYNWILGTKSYSEVLDPDGLLLQRTEYSYDSLGYLKSRQDILTLDQSTVLQKGDPNSGGAPGDVLTTFCYDGDSACDPNQHSGSLRRKTVRGFDPNSTFSYQENYTYAFGSYLKSREIAGVSWLSEDRDVDKSTGLARVSRDPAGIPTTFSYDLIGRLLRVTPASINGTEQFAELSYPDIWTTRLEQVVNTGDKIASTFRFDRFGRMVKVEKRQADASTAYQHTRRDAAGRVLAVSEWTTQSDPNQTTAWTTYDYTDPLSSPSQPRMDPFGRVRRTITADGKVTRTDYFGVSSSTTVEGIQGAYGLLNPKTVQENDAFGRLTRVLAPRSYNTDPNFCSYTPSGADAYYTYDRLDRLTTVRLESLTNPNSPTCPTNSQYRSFIYDALGRQTSATNPENGTVRVLAFDPLGNPLQREDTVHNVFTNQYDAASRLTLQKLTKPGGTAKTILEQTFDQTGAFGYGKGHLTTVLSYDENQQKLLKEELRFNGLNGRLSQRSWRIRGWNPSITDINAQPELLMNISYTSLGLVSGVTYPEKTGSGRTITNPQSTYVNGFLSTITDPNRGVLVQSLAYNLAGGLKELTTRGSVKTTITSDIRNRPASITVVRTTPTPQVTHFDSGTYTYDGAGNITSIGTDTYAYDAMNRLVKAFVVDPVVSSKSGTTDWKYDLLGNMTEQKRTLMDPNIVTTNWYTINTKNQILNYGVTRTVGPSDPNVAMEYDGKGNLTADRNLEYVFDTRNRLTEVHKKSEGSLVARYTYDTSDYRLSKYDAATKLTTYYLRDSSGQTLSEFRRSDDPAAQPAWQKDYIYAVGRHVAMIENQNPAVPGITATSSGWGFDPYLGEHEYATLEWAALPDLDISGYQVERTGGGQTTYFPKTPASNRTHQDWTVVAGETYTYRVQSVDQATNFSGWSEPVVITVDDQTPPGTPVAGAITAGDARVDMAWTAPTDADLWNFKVYRRLAPSGAWQLVGTTSHKSQTTFTDTTALNGTSYDYQVKSVDTSGLESAGVPNPNAWRVLPQDTTPPAVPQGLFAVSAAVSVDLSWRTATDAVSYKLYRSTSPINPSSPGAPLVSQAGTSYTDSNGISPNTTYYYRVRGADVAGNESALSSELVVITRDSSMPTVSNPASGDTTWDYCRQTEAPGVASCYLPDPLLPASFSHENFRSWLLTWDAGQSGANLEKFRVYSRTRADEPFVLTRELPNLGGDPNTSNQYPLSAVWSGALPPLQYRFHDHALNPEQTCQKVTYRISAVGKINQVSRESVLSAQVDQNGILPPPENLTISAEPIDPNIPARLNPQFYGLTLNWQPGGTDCTGQLAGYDVYRTRHTSGPPIRITRERVGVPVMRVDYLPLKGPNNASKGGIENIFEGPQGYSTCVNLICDDPIPKTYSVRAVDIYKNVSASSNGIKGHTNYPGKPTSTPPGSTNPHSTEYGVWSGSALPDPNTLAPALRPTNLSWEWKYDRDRYYDVGPVAGNWALVKWTPDPSNNANNFRLFKAPANGSAEPPASAYSEVPLNMIPGDDHGLREFIWNMKTELACEDNWYKLGAENIHGKPELVPTADPNVWTPAIRRQQHPLAPENPKGTATSNTVTVSWDAFPNCATGHAPTGYSLYRSPLVPNCDPNLMPLEAAFLPVQSVSAPASFISYTPLEPPTNRYWYKVKATWSNGGPSALSAGVCISASGLTEFKFPQDPDLRDQALSEGDLRIAGPPGTSLDASPHIQVEDSSHVVATDKLVASAHRSIGQSGGSNPAVGLFFYHVDHLGTPRVITDVNGNAVSKHKYLPYGEEMSPPPSTNTHEFTGHERDAETGLDYMLARYLSPCLSRFAAPDPSDRNVELPRMTSWNNYAYVENNPLLFFDPDGLDAKLVVRGKYCAGPFYNPLVPHPVFVREDGSTRQFGPKGIGPDDPRHASQYGTVLGGIDDKVLEMAFDQAEIGINIDYDAVSNNCIHYSERVLDRYAKTLLSRCKQGEVEYCKKSKELCQSSAVPADVCAEYEREKAKGNLPAHRSIAFDLDRPMVP